MNLPVRAPLPSPNESFFRPEFAPHVPFEGTGPSASPLRIAAMPRGESPCRTKGCAPVRAAGGWGWFGYGGILGNFFAWVEQLCRFILLLCSNVLTVTSPELFHPLSGGTSEMLISTVPVSYGW